MDIIEMNQKVHTALADVYKNEPHYRPENIRRVRLILQRLFNETKGYSLLDLGCGQGFIIDIAKEFFTYIKGVDITEAMLDKVDTACPRCKVEVELGESDAVDVPDESFDVVTAYSFLHHLEFPSDTIKEAARLLRPGGQFYADLDPNADFVNAINEMEDYTDYPAFVRREIDAIKNTPAETRLAEPVKFCRGGFTLESLTEMCVEAGLTDVRINYNWFIGEAFMVGEEREQTIREYLTQSLPVSRNMFKYISVFARKP